MTTPPSLDTTVVRRLAFAKHVYRAGVAQSEAAEPYSAAAVLTFHDAAELFLQIASEHLDVSTGQHSFMEYWTILGDKLAPTVLQQKESMRRLNKARVALKHHGTLPSKLDIEAFRAAVTIFFNDNMPIVFGTAFDSISLAEYVQPDKARDLIKTAQAKAAAGEHMAGIDYAALAFRILLADYESRKGRWGRGTLFSVGPSPRMSSFHRPEDREISEFMQDTAESLEEMKLALEVLALGLDHRKYSKFRMLGPTIDRTAAGTYTFHRPIVDESSVTAADAEYCIEFVIDASVTIQQFDYSVEPRPRGGAGGMRYVLEDA